MKALFQYISCYSLSRKGWRNCWSSIRFNTSHVTLYPGPDFYGSRENRVSIHLMLLFIASYSASRNLPIPFQYISCYSLSKNSLLMQVWRKLRFNTSHVTLYRKTYFACRCRLLVSIHLMLLFISFKLLNVRVADSFQYISCYSLSLPAQRSKEVH